ncbi:MAG: MFS transporter [Candidatus Hermodarchaeota archaeon]|nr:MFS transporter [Candidatus Hermodarchaeota archaeon]
MSEQRSRGYLIFLVVFMGLVGQMDVWLSLIETRAATLILAEAGLTTTTQWLFGLWQGIFGVIVFLVFFIGYFSDAFGRRKGILALMLVMGVPAGLILFVPSIAFGTIGWFLFIFLYSIVIMGTTSNLWEVPITEESPAKRRGLYGSLAFLISVIPLYALLGTPIMEALGWRWGYGIMAIFMILLLVLLVFMQETRRWTDVQEGRAEKRLGVIEAIKSLGRRDLLYIGVASLVYLAWTMSFKLGTTWSGVFFATTPYAAQFNTILTIGGLMLPISAIISGILLEKLGRNLTLIIGTFGAIFSFVGLGFAGLPAFFWGIYFFMAMVLAWIYVYVTEIFPTPVRSSSVGIAVTASRLGYVLAPLLAAGMFLLFPSDWLAFWVVAALIMIFPLISFLTKPYETKGKELETIDKEK